MANLTKAHEQLFRRTPDESFSSLGAILERCRDDAEKSMDRWRPLKGVRPVTDEGGLGLDLGDGGRAFRLNDWSFSQLCGLAKVSKDTLNRLSPETAGRVVEETLPRGAKPAQFLTLDDRVRSIHGHGYSRLHDRELVSMLMEFAVDFRPPQEGCAGGTGLYRGEQDLFCFMIDPAGWIEIGGEAYAPGFFVWNSEVGRRTVGIQSFWFQAVCSNHIVWDAVDVSEFTRRHTGDVAEALPEIRRVVETLVRRRDDRRDGFAAVLKRAMETKLGDDAEEAMKALADRGFARRLAKQALDLASRRGRFTIFSVVDALTKAAGGIANAGDRAELDQKASRLLDMAGVPAPPWEELEPTLTRKG